MKFSIKFEKSDGEVVIDIQDREVKDEEIVPAMLQLVDDFSKTIGEPIVPYMIRALELVMNAPVSQLAEERDLKSP